MRTTIARVTLRSASPYLQSKPITAPSLPKESGDAYEERTWKLRAHINEAGNLVIPAAALNKALQASAAYLGEKIKGKGQATYSKHFRSGVMVVDSPDTGISVEDVACTAIFCSATGDKRGQGTRVLRKFPTIPTWEVTVDYYILDPIITRDLFQRYLETSGIAQGIGAFRPETNGGWNGRYSVENVDWTEAV